MDKHKENMASGPPPGNCWTSGPGIFFRYIDFYISLDRWQTFVQYDMHNHYSFSELNSSLAFLLYIRII